MENGFRVKLMFVLRLMSCAIKGSVSTHKVLLHHGKISHRSRKEPLDLRITTSKNWLGKGPLANIPDRRSIIFLSITEIHLLCVSGVVSAVW